MCEKYHETIRKCLCFGLCLSSAVCKKMCSVLLVKRTLSFTRDALFTLCTLFPFVPALCTWKGLNLPAVGFWIGGRGRLWCCHREGHAPLLSECVMQQPLLWKPEKTLQVDVWKCYLGLVLSVGGWSCGWWLVTFPLRNTWQVSFEQDQCEYYIKVVLLFFHCRWEFKTKLLMSYMLCILVTIYTID